MKAWQTLLCHGGDSPSNVHKFHPVRTGAHVPQQLEARSLDDTYASDLRRVQQTMHKGTWHWNPLKQAQEEKVLKKTVVKSDFCSLRQRLCGRKPNTVSSHYFQESYVAKLRTGKKKLPNIRFNRPTNLVSKSSRQRNNEKHPSLQERQAQEYTFPWQEVRELLEELMEHNILALP